MRQNVTITKQKALQNNSLPIILNSYLDLIYFALVNITSTFVGNNIHNDTKFNTYYSRQCRLISVTLMETEIGM